MKKLLFCALLTATLLGCGTKESSQPSDDQVMENILSRTSIRVYTDQPVEDAKIQKMRDFFRNAGKRALMCDL